MDGKAADCGALNESAVFLGYFADLKDPSTPRRKS